MDVAQTLPEPRASSIGLRRPGAARRPGELAQASVLESLAVLMDVMPPNIAKGIIIRRPRALALAEIFQTDARAIRRMQLLRRRHGTEPLLVRMPDHRRALILDPDDVHRVLEQSPEPFATASSEKRSALAHFEPRGALISRGVARTERRQLNEEALESGRPVHGLGLRFAELVAEEAGQLLRTAGHGRQLEWDAFAHAWFRMVRRVVLGEAARDDQVVGALMTRLRRRANWAFVLPQQPELRDQLLARIRHYMHTADQGSLVGRMAALQPSPRAAPEHQVPQWLFAFDPAGMATFRALALLATHPEEIAAAREEALHGDPLHQPRLRAAVLESLRLWPTTPPLLRQTTMDTQWQGGVLPAGSGVLIYAPFFHRDDERLPYADRFHPQLWLAERTTRDWPLVPFSSGPAACPARHLVLQLGSNLLGELLRAAYWRLERPAGRIAPGRRLPATLSHVGLRFGFLPRR